MSAIETTCCVVGGGPAGMMLQERREFPTRVTQRLQIVLQNHLIGPALANKGKRPSAPLLIKAMQWPLLRRIPGRLLALGVRPEHVRTATA